jgi:Zn-finger nucleic acid-binding protein
MVCPGCAAEMVSLTEEDQTLGKCAECGGLWVDVSDLNRLLLHSNLPGLETLGGKVNPDADCGQCPTCLIDLMRVEGGSRAEPMGFDTCETCGGIFLESDVKDVTDFKTGQAEVVAFFRKFRDSSKKRVG